jgi:hypothetical protein
MLVAQIALAGLIIIIDFPAIGQGRLWQAPAPPASVPVRPGDQTRRYVPDDAPTGPGFPGDGDVPQRLRFTKLAIDGMDGLLIEGEIAPGDGARFAEHLAGGPLPERIALHSPGGSVSDALDIGRRIRAEGISVVMQPGAACFSACPYILAAGVEREVSRRALVGVHQHYFGENTLLPAFLAVESIQQGQGEVLEYLDAMGIDLRLMAKAMQTPPNSIYILVDAELTDFALATRILD